MTAYKSQKEVGELLGVTARQVHNLTEKGMPRRVQNGRPEYPWPDALKWYIAFKVSAEAAKADPIDLEKARARKMAADAELTELELAPGRPLRGGKMVIWGAVIRVKAGRRWCGLWRPIVPW